MGTFYQVTPFMHVVSLDRALDFFVGVLGFKVWRVGSYAYVQRETVGFRLLELECEEPVVPSRDYAYYIDVKDADALYAELKEKLDALPKEDVFPPRDMSWGQRELLVRAPDGKLIAFGHRIFDTPGLVGPE